MQRLPFLVGCLALATSASGRAAPIPDGAFVRADGTRFAIGDRTFDFVGANLAIMQGERERARYRETLHAVAADGLTVGRVWALGEGPADASDWYRRGQLFRAGPDGFIESAYEHLDRVLAAARAEGVRLVLTLVNNWDDYDGVAEYLRWASLPTDGSGRDRFYRDERTRAFYRAHVAKLLSRTNTVTGVRYVDDPTIFAWLVNESTVDSDAGRDARRDWIVEMSRFIKERDPHHMVSAGLIGYVTPSERREWIRVHRLPEVDYCDSHLYPQMSAYVRSFKRLAELVDDRAQLARFVVGKPLVIGEFGFRTADDAGGRALTWQGTARATWFRRFLERLFADGGAGAMTWIYTPWLGKARDYGIYVDRPDTEDVRRALRLVASRVRTAIPAPSNPLLGASVGERPLYETQTVLRGESAPHAGWRRRDGGELVLEIPPAGLLEARFDRAGTYEDGALAHVYGDGAGHFDYRLSAPAASEMAVVRGGGALRIEARLSAEYPGTSGPKDGFSTVRVLLDGVEVARRAVAADDGAGRVETFTVDDPVLLARLARGAHTLRFEVPDEAGSHGLCIYGAPTGHGPLPVGELGPIRVRWARGR